MWRKSLAADEGGRFINLVAQKTEYELEFLLEISRQGYIRL